MLMLVSPMLNITFILKECCERIHQTPSHFKAHKACTAESQPFPQASVCFALTFEKKKKTSKFFEKIKKKKHHRSNSLLNRVGVSMHMMYKSHA
jgi:hypothetical protein